MPSCPICKRTLSQGKDTPTFPFCTPRCKLVDLGNWLGDRYAVAEPAPAQGDELSEEELAAMMREFQ